MSILIVDDSPSSRMHLNALLQAAGYPDVLAAASAQEAFEHLGLAGGSGDPGSVHLILMDITMPGMDGTEACRRIKADARLRDIPIIMITAHDEAPGVEAAFDAGAMDYVTKPLNPVELKARVRSALTLREETESRKNAYRQLEEQFFHAQKMECVGRLASGIAHDFNNLLMAIIGYTQMGIMKLPPGDRLRDDLEEISRAGESAAGLNRRLMAFARPQVAEPEIVNISTVIADMEKMLRVIVGETIELKMSLEPNLWPICLDPGQFEQVLVNLVVNARDATPNGGKLAIQTRNLILEDNAILQHLPSSSPSSAYSYVVLRVSDTGTGMSEEVKAHLFEPFFTTKEQGKGTGLGLATCYDIVKQYGGHIEVASEIGRGATFEVYLPRTQEAVPPPEPELLGEAPQGWETVLIAEDEPLVRDLLARTLRERGYAVLEATDGVEALDIVENRADGGIDLLLSDIEMPRMGGIELAYRVKSAQPNAQILLISGLSSDAVTMYDVPNATASFIQKPFPPEVLAHKVREILDQ